MAELCRYFHFGNLFFYLSTSDCITCIHFIPLFFFFFKSCSSFDVHFGHKLTKVEVENLSKKKWKYEWEVPAVGMSKGKWAGTGECFIKVCLLFLNCAIYVFLYFVKKLLKGSLLLFFICYNVNPGMGRAA